MSLEVIVALAVSVVSLLASALAVGRLAFRTEVKVEALEEKHQANSLRIATLENVASEGKTAHFMLAERVAGIKDSIENSRREIIGILERLESRLDKEGR